MLKKFLFLHSFFVALFLMSACGTPQTDEQISESIPQEQSAPQSQEGKSQTALNFLNAYVENCNLMSESLSAVDWVNQSNQVTVNFKSALQKMIDEAYASDPEMGLGADPLFNAQDWPEEGFELDRIEAETDYVTLKGKNWPDFKVTLKVIQENGKWLVDGCGMVNVNADL